MQRIDLHPYRVAVGGRSARRWRRARRRPAPDPPRAGPGSTCGWRPRRRRGRQRPPAGPPDPARRRPGSTAAAINAATASGAPSTAAMCTAGGRPTAVRPSSSASAWPTGSHRIRPAPSESRSPRPRRQHRRRRGHGPGRRRPSTCSVSSRGPQILASEKRPAVQQQRRAVSVGRPQFGAGCGDNQCRTRAISACTASPAEVITAVPERRGQFLGSTAGADTTARMASAPQRQLAQRRVDPAAPAAPPPRRRGRTATAGMQCRHRAIVRQRAQATEADIRAAEPEPEPAPPAREPPAPHAAPSTAAGRCGRQGPVPLHGRRRRRRGHESAGTHDRTCRHQVVGPAAGHQGSGPRRCGRIPTTAAHRNWCARSMPTSRACGIRSAGSARLSSPSSQTTTRPSRSTGANTRCGFR